MTILLTIYKAYAIIRLRLSN